jgi:uncharacterized protein (DUF1330 family)
MPLFIDGAIMKYYAVAEIEMTDPGWVRTYVQIVTRLVPAPSTC